MAIRSTLRAIARLQVAFLIGVFLTASPTVRQSAANRTPANGLIAHEWGTFTSLAGENGLALEWRPLAGTSDLPGFVHTITNPQRGRRHNYTDKRNLEAFVRMETPVIYFYADREMVVSTKVEFPSGKITEWYPQARFISGGIDWGRFTVLPQAAVALPTEARDSHYYPARETDAAILRVCGNKDTPKESQYEKFLFYRGVGNFTLPIAAKLDGDRLLLKNTGRATISQAIVFSNRNGTARYQIFDLRNNEAVLDVSALTRTKDTLELDIENLLRAENLYAKEAQAMIKTWRDSWFEEGLRVFYILPRQLTDAVLPMQIDPQPSELVRVLVGRTELITPEMVSDIEASLEKLKLHKTAGASDEARRLLAKYGRFAEPVIKRILQKSGDAALVARLSQAIRSATR